MVLDSGGIKVYITKLRIVGFSRFNVQIQNWSNENFFI